MLPFATTQKKQAYEIEYVFAKQLHISPSDLKNMSLSEIGYIMSLLRDDLQEEEAEYRRMR